MRRVKRFFAVVLLAVVATLGTPAALAVDGVAESPGITSGGVAESPGIRVEYSAEVTTGGTEVTGNELADTQGFIGALYDFFGALF